MVAEPLRRVDPSPIFPFPDEIGLVPLVPMQIRKARAPYFLVVLARALDAELVRRLEFVVRIFKGVKVGELGLAREERAGPCRWEWRRRACRGGVRGGRRRGGGVLLQRCRRLLL